MLMLLFAFYVLSEDTYLYLKQNTYKKIEVWFS